MGTRTFRTNFGNDDFESSSGNSNYNSFQASLRHSGKRLDLMLAYTFSKSIDQASSLGDPLNPFNYRQTRALSAFDLKHNFVATYEYQLPLEHVSRRGKAFSIPSITLSSSVQRPSTVTATAISSAVS